MSFFLSADSTVDYADTVCKATATAASKYIEADRTFICMNYYGHTQGGPYPISMETFSVEKGKTKKQSVVRDYESDTSDKLITKVDGKIVSDEDFTVSLYAMIAETARSSYIPLVKHDDESLQYYEGEIIDIGYDDYIRQKLG